MEYFSWKTSEGVSISNWRSSRGPLPVYMLTPDGRKVFEERYDGYGDFGGLDFFAVIDELNNGRCPDCGNRDDGIDTYYDKSRYPLRLPRFTTDPTKTWEELNDPEYCPDQGYFYADGDDGNEEVDKT